ncbi:MAG: hemin uptake protein HemP, partial [Hyphomicrobiales bacterium]
PPLMRLPQGQFNMSVENEKKNTAEKSNHNLNTSDLFDGKTEIIIHHKGEEYRLRITSNDKLILTK